MYKRTIYFRNSKNILAEGQLGFRKGLSVDKKSVV
jgi:hypothetical protein